MRLRVATQRAQHRETVHTWHHDIQKDQVRLILFRHRDGGLAVSCLQHDMTVLGQHLSQYGSNGGGVINHQHQRSLGCAAARHGAAFAMLIPENPPDQPKTRHDISPRPESSGSQSRCSALRAQALASGAEQQVAQRYRDQ